MKDFQEQWQQCQEKIQQQLQQKNSDPWVYATWFQPVMFESFDPQKRQLLLTVPSTYVYEFIEHYYVRLMSLVIAEVYGKGVDLRYRILQNGDGAPVDFIRTPQYQVPAFQIPDAANRLRTELTKRLGDRLQWLPAYDKVASWLSNNKGRGLLCVGTTGLGKSLICRDILPLIFQQSIVCVDASEIHKRLDELTRQRCVIVDDLGKEDVKVFGQVDHSFYKLCDAAERLGILLIITTNFSTNHVNDPRYPANILDRYGNEVASRLRSLIRTIEFEGPDMRK
jgi:DNA replication protein DnaC